MTRSKGDDNTKVEDQELELDAESVKDLDVGEAAAEEVLGGGGSHSTRIGQPD